jgi:hypothetical protein
MPDETRVFDVTRPSHVSPPATSKPVIVGHQPGTSDPMVREESSPFGTEKPSVPEPTKIRVTDDSPDGRAPITEPLAPSEPPHSDPKTSPSPQSHYEGTAANESPAIFSAPDDAITEPPASPSEPPQTPISTEPSPPPDSPVPPTADPLQSNDIPSTANIEGLHFTQPPTHRGWLKIVIVLLLAALIAGYLAVDAGLVGSGINLPFHIFKQETSTPAKQVTVAKKTVTTTSSIPTGFKRYTLEGTGIKLAAPTAWGEPTSKTELGYSERGGSNTPDGTYAYLVSFADNKDIQIAVTSSKYLPPARSALYYDFLQWCTGTNDDKFYQATLKFTTKDKVDIPATVSCDKGPMENAEKLDKTTLIQTNMTDSAGKKLGDIYTKNIDDPEFMVLRVKDTTMTNSENIKKVLTTVQTAK